MPATIDPNLHAEVLHDTDAAPIDAVTRADGKRALAVDALLSAASDVAIDGNVQVQTLEKTTALGASETFNGTEHDCLNYEAFSVSVHLARGAADTNVDVVVEQRAAQAGAGSTFRPLETTNLPLTGVGATQKFDRVYSVTARYVRVTLVNKTANALGATELVTMKKPIS